MAAHSPAVFNIIENLWSYLDQNIPKSGRKSINTFRSVLHETWGSVPQELIDRLINSVPHRLRAVIEANGGQQ